MTEETNKDRSVRTKIRQIKFPVDDTSWVEKQVTVKGWVKTIRNQKTFSFVEINDGSTLSNFQVVVDQQIPDYEQLVARLSTGSAVACTGTVQQSPGKKQNLELHADTVDIIGACNPQAYPLQKKTAYLRIPPHHRTPQTTYQHPWRRRPRP